MREHLPDLDLPGEELERELTVRDLLCHRHGIRSTPIVLLDAYTGEITGERYHHWLARGEVAGELAYSNVHYTLLGRVVEAVTGRPWRDHLDEALFTPAGLDRTTGYASELYGDEDAAFPSERAGDGFRRTAQRKTDRVMHAAGGLGTCAVDTARYLRLHLGDGALGETRLLEAETARSMRAVQAGFEAPQGSIRVVEGFGLAWQVGRFAGHPFVAHGGGYVGTGAYYIALPEDGVAVAVLVNGGGPAQGWADIVVIDLLERLTGEEAAWDVHARFTERVRRLKAERGEPTADDDPPGVPVTALTRPIGLYTGWFRNEHLGTLVLTREGDSLHFALGDMALPAATREGLDRVTLEILGEPNPAELVVGSDGLVNTVRLETGIGTYDFVR